MNTGGLAKFLKIEIVAKVTLTRNLDIKPSLANEKTGNAVKSLQKGNH